MKYKVDDTQLAAVADAIRTKTGSSDLLAFPDDFVGKINEITATLNSEVASADYIFPQQRAVYYNSSVALPITGYTGNVGPVRSATWSSTFTGGGNLYVYSRMAGTNPYIQIVNTSTTAVTIPKNVKLTVTFNKYSASL